jgi:hypothetical protein
VSIEATVDLIFMLTLTYNFRISNRSGFSFFKIETDTEGQVINKSNTTRIYYISYNVILLYNIYILIYNIF